MGRLPKIGIDYFTHDVGAAIGPTLFTVQNSFGNDGYALWFKLLEFMGTKEDLYADFSVVKDWEYFLAIARVDETKAKDILNLLAKIDAIDKELWIKHQIAWSDNFAGRAKPVFDKRGTLTPDKPEIEGNDAVTGESKQVAPKRKKKSEDNPDKKKYAEFVCMEEREYQSLVERYGEQATLKFIELLDNYKGSSGKTYKSDYRAILNWVVDKTKKEYPKLFTEQDDPSDGGNPFDD